MVGEYEKDLLSPVNPQNILTAGASYSGYILEIPRELFKNTDAWAIIHSKDSESI